MKKVYLIGLGNPGFQYKNTRHNAGFMMVDRFVRRRGRIEAKRRTRSKFVREVKFDDHSVITVKPLLYMNRSGDALLSMRDELSDGDSRLIVVFDDVSLPFGSLRLRPGGGAGGHKGAGSIIKMLKTEEFPRLRIGIGAEAEMPLEDYVLLPFTRGQRAALPELLDRACDAVETFITDGMEAAMNRFNQRESSPDP
ncbi:MAG: aminoacyl-tRNA hydrolase [bacterium]